MYVWVVPVTIYLLDTHLGNSIGRRTVIMVTPLLLSSGPARYEAVVGVVLHNFGTSPVGDGG